MENDGYGPYRPNEKIGTDWTSAKEFQDYKSDSWFALLPQKRPRDIDRWAK